MVYDLQKGSMTKRISAFLFDFIMLITLIAGCALLLSAVLGYDGYMDTFNNGMEHYQQAYDVEFNITQDQLNALSKEEQERFQEATAALNADQAVVHAYNMMISLAIAIVSGSILLAYLVTEFFIPLWLGNGQTLGKKIFSLAVMRNDGVKINAITLFVRAFLGKCTIETMVPVLVAALVLFGDLGVVGTAILVGLAITQVVMVIVSQTNAVIHDKLANTIVVDMASQMIFSSELEMMAYKNRLQEEKAAKQKYF